MRVVCPHFPRPYDDYEIHLLNKKEIREKNSGRPVGRPERNTFEKTFEEG